MAANRIRANGFLWAADFEKAMLDGLREGRTVTRFVLEPRRLDGKGPNIEFELVVTKFGDKRLPRVAGTARRA